MKSFLFIFCLFITGTVIAQDPLFKLSVQQHSLTISLEEDNAGKSISLALQPSFTSADQFVIVNANWKEEKDWKRTFTLVDSENNEIGNIPETNKAGTFCISLTSLVNVLQTSHTYKIYTVAYPRDPQKAMLVKIARQLVCTVEVK